MFFCASLCPFLCLASPPSLLSKHVVLWWRPTISDPFLRFTANFTQSSLRHSNPSIIPLFILPQFEAELSIFRRKAHKAHTLWQFYALPQLSSQAFYFILIFYIIAQIIFFNTSPLHPICCLPWSPLLVCAYHPPSPVLLAGPPDRCGSLCGTNRAEAEGCLRPFRLITSHLCVHKQTNTVINLRVQTGGGRGEKRREREREKERDADRRRKCFVSFTLVHEAGHAICHVLSLLHH